MSSLSSKILSKFNPRNFNFGKKINLLVFTLVIVSVAVIAIAGLYYMKRSIMFATEERLTDLGRDKKEEVEKGFFELRQTSLDFMQQSNILRGIQDLKDEFNAYPGKHSDAFWSDSLAVLSEALYDYYDEHVVSKIRYKTPVVDEIFPQSDIAKVLQYHFLASNTLDIEDKARYQTAKDQSDYSYRHELFHPKFSKLKRDLNANDIYLVDPVTGSVFYSVSKKMAFASNLNQGPYSQTSLALAFKKASVDLLDQQVAFEDFSISSSNLNKPCSYLSFPVKQSDRIVAVVVIELGSAYFNDLLYSQWMSLGEGSLEYNLIGSDMLVRNDSRSQLVDESAYLLEIQEKSMQKPSYEKVLELGGACFVQGYRFGSFDELEEGQGFVRTLDYEGEKVFAYVTRIEFGEMNWQLITKVETREALGFINRMIWIYVGIFLVLFLITLLTAKAFRNSIIYRLKTLRDSMTKLHQGEQTENIEFKDNDELGETIDLYNNLRKRIGGAASFANELSDGNYNINYDQLGDNDNFAKSLNTLKDTLLKNKLSQEEREQEDEKRNWINSGIAKFNDLLRQSNDNIEELSYLIIENLVAYLEANQGGVYLVEGEDSEKVIKLAAAYAYDRRKYLQKSIEIGEGLLGNCYLEKKSRHLNILPDDYIQITSGLGQANPKCLYIVPLKVDEDVLGLVEIASFKDFEKHQIDFIEEVAGNIAATFRSVKLNSRTALLLEESKSRAHEIAQQEEEMRQNLEEMQATQEELARLREEDEKRTKDLLKKIESSSRMTQLIVNQMSDELIILDNNGKMILANAKAALFYDTTPELMVGKTYMDIMPPDRAEKEKKTDGTTLREGEQTYNDTIEIDGHDANFFVIKRPFYVDSTGEIGIYYMRRRIN